MTTWREIALPAEVINARSSPGRDTGVTMVIDNGLGLAASRDVLSVAGGWIDHWKLSFGTSALMPETVLQEKLALIEDAGVLVFPGGTLFESAVYNGHGNDYFEQAAALGFTAVEISEGTIELPTGQRSSYIGKAARAGLTVVSEVGKKDPVGQPGPRKLATQALSDLEAGSDWVVVEGRESGRNVGVFNPAGGVYPQAVETIARHVGNAMDRLVWEAPRKSQQVAFIHRFGPNVNLGNIDPRRVLATEALRAGLRFETLQTAVREKQSGTSDDLGDAPPLGTAFFPTP